MIRTRRQLSKPIAPVEHDETQAKSIVMPTTFDGQPILYQSRGTYYTLKGEPIEGLGFIGI